MQSLTCRGQRLGEMRDNNSFEEKTMPLKPGDILFMYTDGVIEGKNLAGDQFTKKQLRKIIEANISGGPDKVIESIMKKFMKHSEGKPLDDDVTLAAARIFPKLADAGKPA
jgi:sigma-B regulation protein RsbU (phosphoserine phosphatase)